MLALTTAQTVFCIAFAVVVAMVSFFALYVISTVVWSDRWVKK
jgi:hypothetical protein